MRAFRGTSAVVLMFANLAALAWAGDSWKDKPYQQWSKSDVAGILNDSPWAKSVTIENSTGPMSGVLNPMDQTARPGATASNPGNVSSAHARPGVELQDLSGRYTALWASALTVRRAIVRGAVLAGKLTEAEAESDLAQMPTDYELTLSGGNLTAFAALGQEEITRATSLELKKTKRKLAPSTLQIERSPDATRVIRITFHFPATIDGTPTISASEKEADFLCKLKRVNLKFPFDLDRMKTKKGRDL